MSTAWDLYCIDCQAHAGFRITGGSAILGELWSKRQAFIAAREACTHLECTAVDWELKVLGDHESASFHFPEWAKTHDKHRVVTRSEYGEILGQCWERVVCAACGHSHNCKLPRGHEGPHAERTDP